MRLLTHNMLQCHVKTCTDPALNFPLQLKDIELEQVETDRNDDLLLNLLQKVDWNALKATVVELGVVDFPQEIPENPQNDESFMQKFHEILMETNITQGQMVCRGCGHVYPIKNGIPNMLLAEHEI